MNLLPQHDVTKPVDAKGLPLLVDGSYMCHLSIDRAIELEDRGVVKIIDGRVIKVKLKKD